MAVPTEAALNLLSLHCLIAGNNIFDCGRNEVSEMGQTGGKWWTVIKNVLFGTFTLRDGLFESVIVRPELKDFLFLLREINFRVNCFIHIILL